MVMTASHVCIMLQFAEYCHIKIECLTSLIHSYLEEDVFEEIRVLQNFAQQVPV